MCHKTNGAQMKLFYLKSLFLLKQNIETSLSDVLSTQIMGTKSPVAMRKEATLDITLSHFNAQIMSDIQAAVEE